MPQAGSGPVNGCSDPVLASWSAVSLPTIPSWPGTHISWTLLCLASCMRDWWQSKTNFEVIWCLPSALIAISWIISGLCLKFGVLSLVSNNFAWSSISTLNVSHLKLMKLAWPKKSCSCSCRTIVWKIIWCDTQVGTVRISFYDKLTLQETLKHQV
jgi:hypothetical protein